MNRSEALAQARQIVKEMLDMLEEKDSSGRGRGTIISPASRLDLELRYEEFLVNGSVSDEGGFG